MKEEIIDNDRLTCANLNRIKQLEAALASEHELVKTLETENEELRDAVEAGRREEGEATNLREALAERESELAERENQLLSLSHRISENSSMNKDPLSRRDSLMGRIGGFGKHFI